MTSQDLKKPTRVKWTGPAPEEDFYQPISAEEDKRRTNTHYDKPPAFFLLMTGGEWNVYSANLWDKAQTDTESQEAKLDLMAECMELKPGQRIMDVGCGWAGPLVYLCKKYGVSGVGLTLSAQQKGYAEERIARYGVDAKIHQSHWRDYQDDRPFDAIYTDEVIVHFNDLGGFFAKCHSLLRDGGLLVNKEIHFTHSQYCSISRGLTYVNEVFGYTGNYRTLVQELSLLDENNFEIKGITPFPPWHYQKTMSRWLSNMHEHREELEALVGRETYLRFRKYLKIAHFMVGQHQTSLEIVAGRKI